MSKKRLLLNVLGTLVLLLACGPLAHAQAIRTWVSRVGDDANPCSLTAPCRTFAGAISKTAAGGEINALDPGNFGAVTITKSITISSEGFEAGVLVSGTNGIIVDVPNATDLVVLRGLDIEGLGTGLGGITVLTGGTVYVENCIINRFTQSGINFAPTVDNSELLVVDSIVRNSGTVGSSTSQAILINPTATAQASLDHVRLEGNIAGLRAQGNSTTSVRYSVATGNSAAGFSAASSGTVLNIERRVATNNGTGVVCNSGATVSLDNTHITNNETDIAGNASCASFKNNDIGTTPAIALTPINPQ